MINDNFLMSVEIETADKGTQYFICNSIEQDADYLYLHLRTEEVETFERDSVLSFYISEP